MTSSVTEPFAAICQVPRLPHGVREAETILKRILKASLRPFTEMKGSPFSNLPLFEALS